MEKSFFILKIAIVGGTLAFASSKQNWGWGGVPPSGDVSPHNHRPCAYIQSLPRFEVTECFPSYYRYSVIDSSRTRVLIFQDSDSDPLDSDSVLCDLEVTASYCFLHFN